MTAGDWIGVALQVIAAGAAAVAAIASWRSVVGVSKERKFEERRRANEHLKAEYALVVEWAQAYSHDRQRAVAALMALRAEILVHTVLEGPLPQCLALVNTEPSTIKPDDVDGLADAAMKEIEAAMVRVWEGHTVDLEPASPTDASASPKKDEIEQ